jgi:hypothetical protein
MGLNLVFVVVLDLRVEPPTTFFVRPLLPDMVFSVANARPSNDFDRHPATSICSALLEATLSAGKCKACASFALN